MAGVSAARYHLLYIMYLKAGFTMRSLHVRADSPTSLTTFRIRAGWFRVESGSNFVMGRFFTQVKFTLQDLPKSRSRDLGKGSRMSSEERAHRVRRGRLGLDSRAHVRPPSPWLDIDPPFSPPDTLHFLHVPAGGEDLKGLQKAAAAAEVTIPVEFCRCAASEPPGRGHLPQGRASGRPAR